jgi:hypothetical protein
MCDETTGSARGMGEVSKYNQQKKRKHPTVQDSKVIATKIGL